MSRPCWSLLLLQVQSHSSNLACSVMLYLFRIATILCFVPAKSIVYLCSKKEVIFVAKYWETRGRADNEQHGNTEFRCMQFPVAWACGANMTVTHLKKERHCTADFIKSTEWLTGLTLEFKVNVYIRLLISAKEKWMENFCIRQKSNCRN